MAKRRRHDSSRASWLATNSSNAIGRLRVHNPPGDRKSGIPHSVEMPAPVNGTIEDASAIMLPSASTPLRRSGAITLTPDFVEQPAYSMAVRIGRNGEVDCVSSRSYAALATGSFGSRTSSPFDVGERSAASASFPVLLLFATGTA